MVDRETVKGFFYLHRKTASYRSEGDFGRRIRPRQRPFALFGVIGVTVCRHGQTPRPDFQVYAVPTLRYEPKTENTDDNHHNQK